jgi:hypothetical protein
MRKKQELFIYTSNLEVVLDLQDWFALYYSTQSHQFQAALQDASQIVSFPPHLNF